MQETTQELQSADPGYFARLTAKIIDNLQVNIEHLYVRIEDELSYPGNPFAFGITIERIEAVTTDESWNFTYIADAEQVHRKAVLNGLTIFLNYSDKREEVFMEHLMGEDNLGSFIKFAHEQCTTKKEENRCLLLPFNSELRMVLNKNPKANLKPQVWASLKVGETFDESGSKGTENFMGFNVEINQISVMMKFLEYTGMYSNFQTGVLAGYQKEEFLEYEKSHYDPVYREYIQAMRAKNAKLEQAKRDELAKLEAMHSLAAVKKLRMTERVMLEFEGQKEESRKKAEEKVKKLEKEQSSLATSVWSFFGSSSAREEQEKKKEELEKYREQLLKEEEEKFVEKKLTVERKINEILANPGEVNVNLTSDMPPDYVWLNCGLEVNKFSVAISQGQPFNKSKKMAELIITKVKVSRINNY